MKATGIVRRIDELGRVVIPKEIRSTLRLKSGDPLEIFTERDELMLKKYSPIASLGRFSEGTAKSLNDLSGHLAIVCDTDEVLCASGSGKREVTGKTVSKDLDKIMQERKSYVANLSEGGDIVPIIDGEQPAVTAQVIVPIVSNGDCLGAVALISTEEGAKMEAGACKLAQLSATILANQFE
ncbi:MAG: stage V sporulation T C-terminal domain-containing protein [Candidatus Coproplasma sp.]